MAPSLSPIQNNDVLEILNRRDIMKKLIIAATVAFISATSAASASPLAPVGHSFIEPDVLINMPNTIASGDEMACWGCFSTNTGRIRSNYVRPHVRSNGSFVNGYWKS